MDFLFLFSTFILCVTYTLGGILAPDRGYFRPENDCNRSGGICILDELCDSPRKDIGGCPSQRSLGAVCCDKLPKNETRCEKFGGACLATADCVRGGLSRAENCGTGQVCCLLE